MHDHDYSRIARSDSAYPRPGQPLLPAGLLPFYGDEPLPKELASEVGLPETTRLSDLGADVWDDLAPEAIAQLVEFVTKLVRASALSRLANATDVRLFDPPVPLNVLRLPPRARNFLIRSRIARDGVVRQTTLSEVACGRNVGGTTILQILAAAEEAQEAAAAIGRPAGNTADARASSDETRRPSRAVRTEAKKLLARRWSRKVTREDPRLGAELSALAPSALTANAAAQLLPVMVFEPHEARGKAGAVRRFIQRADAMGRMTVEAELEDLLSTITPREHQRKALRRRLGWGGQAPATLEVASLDVGLTREGVRQIERKFKLRAEGAWTPVLDRAIRMLEGIRFATTAEVNETLRAAGLVGGEFPLTSLLEAARFFGREVPSLTEHDGTIAPTDFAEAKSSVLQVARRLTDRWGATTVAELASVLIERGDRVDEEIVRRSLATSPKVRFLDGTHEWFWMSATERNRLLNIVRKIMSVAGSIDIGELRDGVGRHHRMGAFRPPRAVLARLCEDTGDYEVDGQRITGKENLPDWRDVLPESEQMLVEVLFDFGPIMRRADLEQKVVGERGMNRNSFYIYLTYSPILERYAPGVYGLRGASVTAGEVKALIPRITHGKVMKDDGWTSDRRPWVTYRLSKAAATSGVLAVPAALTPMLQGQFHLFAEDDAPMGTLVVEETRMWGLSPFYRRRGVEAGDHLLITFELKSGSAKVEAGDETVALKYQSDE